MDDARLQRLLRQHVRTDRLLGADAMPVGDVDAIAARLGVDVNARIAPTTSTQTTAQHAHAAPPDRAPGTAPGRASDRAPGTAPAARSSAAPPPRSAPAVGRSNRADEAAPPGRPPSQPAPAAATEIPALPAYHPIARDEKIRLLTEMNENEVRGCEKCELCRGRTQTVFGDGDPDANLIFIGEGPGQNEDEQGLPFVGRAGELLNKMIVAMGLERKQVYIANVVKCRPPNNRTPTPQEVATCWDYLRRQIATIQPRVIVTLGGPATKQLLDTRKGITAIRGLWHHFTGLMPDGPTVPVMPTFHPAYLLRSYTKENRAKVWSDLQKAMALLKEEE